MSRLLLIPNVGAEEPDTRGLPAQRAVARLWRLLFPDRAEWPEAEPADWPDWRTNRGEPAFDWLPESGGCAWWNDAASAALAERAGLSLFGAAPEVVARVHDKAFAAQVCEQERLAPRILRGCVRAFAPAELSDADALRTALRRELASWPDEFAGRATLKPRLGTSGRGRVRLDEVEDSGWEGALPRLAAQGGALLEPWLERVADYSVQLHLARDGALTLLGSLELCTSPSGLYRGHRGEIDHRGRVSCGAALDDALLGPAADLARAAHAAGYHGPCGVDAFVFRHAGEPTLRPGVELNARFTAGTVVLGLLHRAREAIAEALPPQPGERRCFVFSFAPGAARDAERIALPRSALRFDFEAAGARLELAAGPLLDGP